MKNKKKISDFLINEKIDNISEIFIDNSSDISIQKLLAPYEITTAGVAGTMAAAASAVGALAWQGVSSKSRNNDHPLRRRVLTTLEKHPGLCYRELQSTLNAANGTLRHHLDVLQSRRSVTVMHVNGRSCYFAGAPSQIEVLKGISVNEQRAARSLPIGLSLVQRLIIEDIVKEGIPRSQSDYR